MMFRLILETIYFSRLLLRAFLIEGRFVLNLKFRSFFRAILYFQIFPFFFPHSIGMLSVTDILPSVFFSKV